MSKCALDGCYEFVNGAVEKYCCDLHRQVALTRAAEAEVVRLKAAVKTARDFAFQGVHEPDSRHYCKAILELLEKVPGIPSARVVEAGRYGRRKSGGKARAKRAPIMRSSCFESL